MALIACVSMITYIIIHKLFLYKKIIIVKKYNGYGVFAEIGNIYNTSIDWRIARKNKEFTAEWKLTMPKYRILYTFGLVQCFIILPLTIIFS